MSVHFFQEWAWIVFTQSFPFIQVHQKYFSSSIWMLDNRNESALLQLGKIAWMSWRTRKTRIFFVEAISNSHVHSMKRICQKSQSLLELSELKRPWRRGIVVITSAYRSEDPGFESRQGVRFLGIYTLQWCFHNLICIVIVCIILEKKINDYFLKANWSFIAHGLCGPRVIWSRVRVPPGVSNWPYRTQTLLKLANFTRTTLSYEELPEFCLGTVKRSPQF
jgi:hypothetical protein